MADLFTIQNITTLALLTLLQAVLGFDNLLYISLESKRVPDSAQQFVRRLGIGLAIFLRIALLIGVVQAIEKFKAPFYSIDHKYLHGEFNVHSVIVLAGGGFIIYTAFKEISHMLVISDIDKPSNGMRSVGASVFWIVIMNLVFSFDSILSAIALTNNVWVMATAVVISGLLMIYLADHVSEFLKRNRMYEVLGLFILFIVGIMLLSEGGHIAKLAFFGHHVEAMSKVTFYFVIGVLVVVDLVQGRYQKKLLAQQAAQTQARA